MIYGGDDRLYRSLRSHEHGNYCSFLNLDPTYKKTPIDWIDAACMLHDQCYDNKFLDCGCDNGIVENMMFAMKLNDFSLEMKSIAQTIARHYRTNACRCLKQPGNETSYIFISDVKGDEKLSCF